MNARAYARSAAGFAVVAVRRGLPLESVDTFPTITSAELGSQEEQRVVAGSRATLVEGSSRNGSMPFRIPP